MDHRRKLDTSSAPPGAEAAVRALRVQIIRSTDELSSHEAAWDGLARAAVEPNAFHEPWVMLPALRSLAGGEDFAHTLVWSGEELVGYVPFVRERPVRGLPFTRFCVWEHDQSPLSLPLLHRDHARQALTAILDAARDAGAAQVMLPSFSSDGAFSHALTDVLEARLATTEVTEEHTRPLFRPRASAEAYLAEAIGPTGRRTLRKQEKKLEALGAVRHEISRSPDEVARFVEDFLALEARGWKGERGTAFASSEAGARFFRDVARGGAARGAVLGSTLRVGDRVVAVRFAIRSGAAAFGYKSAYDEELAKLSPGVHLELHAIEAMHRDPSLAFLDSCAVSRSSLYSRLFLDRRGIRSQLVGTGHALGDAAIAFYPAARFAKRMLARARA